MPLVPWWFLALFVLGVNFAIWGTIGVIRLAETRTGRLARRRVATLVALPKRADRAETGPIVSKVSLGVGDVAVLMPAHNEAAVLGASLDAIMKLVPARNVHVVSDGSTDDTPQIARRAGARVHETERNVGKAGALREAIERFRPHRPLPGGTAARRRHQGGARLLRRGAAALRDARRRRRGRVRANGA